MVRDEFFFFNFFFREGLSHRLFVVEGKKSVTVRDERRAVEDSNRKDMDLVKGEEKSRLRKK